MHEFLSTAVNSLHAFHLADGSAGDSNGIVVAFIAAGGVVITAAFTLLGVMLNNRHTVPPAPPVPDDDALADELTRRAQTAEALCESQSTRIKELQDYLWEHGTNPYTFKPIGDSSA